jgi:hypothetical protein
MLFVVGWILVWMMGLLQLQRFVHTAILSSSKYTDKQQAVAIIQAGVVLGACSHGFGRTVDEIQPSSLVILQQVCSDGVIARWPVADQPQAVLWKQHSIPHRTGPFEGIGCCPAPAAVRRQNAKAVLYRIFGFRRAMAVSFHLCHCFPVQSFTSLDSFRGEMRRRSKYIPSEVSSHQYDTNDA